MFKSYLLSGNWESTSEKYKLIQLCFIVMYVYIDIYLYVYIYIYVRACVLLYMGVFMNRYVFVCVGMYVYNICMCVWR